MTVDITLRIRDAAGDLQGLKELLAADFEKYGNVTVTAVRQLPEEDRQLKMRE